MPVHWTRKIEWIIAMSSKRGFRDLISIYIRMSKCPGINFYVHFLESTLIDQNHFVLGLIAIHEFCIHMSDEFFPFFLVFRLLMRFFVLYMWKIVFNKNVENWSQEIVFFCNTFTFHSLHQIFYSIANYYYY